jgi:hypothetical protein
LYVVIAAYERLGGSAGIIRELSLLRSENYSIRRLAAIELIQLLQNNPKSGLLLWNRLSFIVRRSHYDHIDKTTHADDGSGRHGDRSHTDNGGIGVEFPPYPFND